MRSPSPEQSEESVVLTNGRIWTGNAHQPWADTLAISGKQITYVGDAVPRVRTAADAHGTRQVDLGRRVVLPGLIDAHIHPTAVARSSWHVRLPWTHDVDELLTFVRKYGEEHPVSESPFLYFEYYPGTMFGERRPTKQLLDSAISDRPVLCQDFGEHAAWVNTRMLEMMRVDKDTPDPVPGLEMFVRDPDGEPTGHLLEGVQARFLDSVYDRLGWRPPEAVTADVLRPVLRFLTEHGVTSMFEAVLDDEDTLRALVSLEAAGELHHFYEGAPRFRTLADLPTALEEVKRYQERYGSARISVRTVKLFLDGTNETGNSAVLEPHRNAPGTHSRGQLQIDADELTECLLRCNDAGVDMHIHMVGDRAFRTGCDAVEAARRRALGSESPWRIQVTFAHCELVDPADMERPAELGIMVNWTTHWSAGYFGDAAREHLGAERWNRMYAFNEIAASGAVVTFSSDVVTDYELHRANPFFGMQVARTRVDPEYPLDATRYPASIRPAASSTLPLEVLLQGYTIDAARQLRIDDRVGSLEVGKLANLVVLDGDLFGLPPERTAEVTPAAVLFEGQAVAGVL